MSRKVGIIASKEYSMCYPKVGTLCNNEVPFYYLHLLQWLPNTALLLLLLTVAVMTKNHWQTFLQVEKVKEHMELELWKHFYKTKKIGEAFHAKMTTTFLLYSNRNRCRLFISYVPDCTRLDQSCNSNPHFLWHDIQLSKDKINRDYTFSLVLDPSQKPDDLVYRSAPCNGVKQCSASGCMFVAPVSHHWRCEYSRVMKFMKSVQ